MNRKLLVTGGVRSGKTGLAEARAQTAAEAAGVPVVYVATATAGDEEMALRIQRHQRHRPTHWRLAEEPLALGRVLQNLGVEAPAPLLLIDCMSLWLTNLLLAGDEVFSAEREAFLQAVQAYPGPLVIVSNEVGLGIIGMDALTRRFADELGWLNQTLAGHCDEVVMSVAGLPLTLKAGG